MRGRRGQSVAEYLGMLLAAAAIAVAVASLGATDSIREALRGTNGTAVSEPEPPRELSRRLAAVTEELRSSGLPEGSAERRRLALERRRLEAAYAKARRDEDRRRRTGRE